LKEQLTILTTTYAVHPSKGSEEGLGWNYVLQIASHNKVISITRKNNRAAIEAHMAAHPSALWKNITFLYYDLPYWMRFWKKGSRGAMLYYILWQRGVVRFIKKHDIKFDIVQQINFPNDWTPCYLWKLNKPFVWGPIGHHSSIPSQYLAKYPLKYAIKDQLTTLIKWYFWNLSPALKKTKTKADVVIAMNSKVNEVLDLTDKEHIVFPSVASEDLGYKENRLSSKFNLISAGRFVPLKGFDLTILGFSKFLKAIPEEARAACRLTLYGKGPEEEYLLDLIKQEKIEHYVDVVPWIERAELVAKMRSASAFLFPSHEGAGMVIPEALSVGLPVICLNNSGPGELIDNNSGVKINIQSYEGTISAIAQELQNLFYNPKQLLKLSKGARQHYENWLNWDVKGILLNNIHQHLNQSRKTKSTDFNHLTTEKNQLPKNVITTRG
jgi:glycosyltransferase involved in cell wall biosynthesis